jgi:hypothetical protein
MRTRTPIPVLTLALAGAWGCASVLEPKAELSAADHALRRAEQAKEAVAREDFLEGRRLAENATVVAQLAEAKARKARAQQVATDARANLDALRNDSDPSGGAR